MRQASEVPAPEERDNERRAVPPKGSRRYRCESCGLLYPAEELTPEFNEEGRRIGWTCWNCV